VLVLWGLERCLGAVGDLDVQYPGDRVLDGLDWDDEGSRDLRVGPAAGQQVQDLPLSLGETSSRRASVGALAQ